ncbi:unannotated protein [freshwater metagenome]|uniref:Unannotated protein n=1 Tax=freshwater metagenome TaxID=449393 RepID=A0A6J6BTX7_9ZZZZ
MLPIRIMALATPVMDTMAIDNSAIEEYRRSTSARFAPTTMATTVVESPPVHSETKTMCKTRALSANPWFAVAPEWLISANGHADATAMRNATASQNGRRAIATTVVATTDMPVAMSSNRPRLVSVRKNPKFASNPSSMLSSAPTTVK